MAASTQMPSRSGGFHKNLSKVMLLPMSATSARELSLTHHLALASCRGGNGNRYLINQIIRAVYMAYYLQRAGFGDVPFESFEHAEAAFENSLAIASKSGKWLIVEPDVPTIEQLLALHDKQLNMVPLHRVVEAEVQLRRFVAGTAASPLRGGSPDRS